LRIAISMKINFDTRLSQVKSAVLEYISQNGLKRNSQLPSEANIAKTLGVSRNTLREAYISLENEGVIIRRHGIGTFVAHPPIIHDSLNSFFPFAHIIHKVGYTPHFKTFSNRIIDASKEVAERLNLSLPTEVRCLRRLVLADDRPAMYVIDYFPPSIETENIDWEKFDGNLVNFLSQNISIQLHQIQSEIRAAAIDKHVSSYLGLPEGKPVLSIRSTIFNLDNKPITFSRIHFNSEIVELTTVRMIPKS